MAKPKHPGPNGHHSQDHHGDEPRNEPEGRDFNVFVDIVKRRLAGGVPATPEAYARGLEQWKQLPGAVTRDAGTIKGALDAPPSPGAEDPEGEQPS